MSSNQWSFTYPQHPYQDHYPQAQSLAPRYRYESSTTPSSALSPSNTGVNFSNPYIQSANIGSYSASKPQLHPRQPFDMLGVRTMNNASLVAAALGPPNNTPQRPELSAIRISTPATRPAHQNLESSPLTELTDSEFSTETERRTELPSKQAGRARRRKRRRSSSSEIGGNKAENAHHHSSRPRKRTACDFSKANDPAADNNNASDGFAEPETPSIQTNKKSSRNRSKRLVRKKPHGIRVPQTLEDAGSPDKMMWEWKNMGKGWEDIRNEWQRLTGVKPGQSSLSVRYIKLNENFARNGAAGDKELLQFKREAEQELMSQVWEKVAEKMLAFNILSEHNPKDLEKRYNLLVRSGFNLAKVAQEEADETAQEGKYEPDTNLVVSKMEADTEIRPPDELEKSQYECYDPALVPRNAHSATSCGDEGRTQSNRLSVEFSAPPHYDDLTSEPQYVAATYEYGDGATEYQDLPDQNQADEQQQQQQSLHAGYGTHEEHDSLPQPPTSEYTMVPSSPAITMPSSPFLKSLLAYGSESD